MPYPSDPTAREAARQEIRDREIGLAVRRAEHLSRSSKCTGSGVAVQHAGTPGGCAKDGSGCLCDCHDRTEPKGRP